MKLLNAILLMVALLPPIAASAQEVPAREEVAYTKVEAEQPAEPQSNTPCFPLHTDNVYHIYTYIIDLNDDRVREKYQELFLNNNFEFTGYVWASFISQMLESADKNIADNVFMKAEDDIVGFTFTRPDVKKKFAEFLCGYVSNPKVLERFIKHIDRSHVNNY